MSSSGYKLWEGAFKINLTFVPEKRKNLNSWLSPKILYLIFKHINNSRANCEINAFKYCFDITDYLRLLREAAEIFFKIMKTDFNVFVIKTWPYNRFDKFSIKLTPKIILLFWPAQCFNVYNSEDFLCINLICWPV